LQQGKPGEAVVPLGFMFRHIRMLSQVSHVVPRIAAVHLRRDALSVLAEVARHAATDRSTLEHLHEMLVGQLASWPPDADTWIGDRAVGLHTYEIIREGHLTSVLTVEEIDQFKSEGNLKSLFRAVVGNIDGDQLFYLTAMQKMIDACERPFYQRADVFQGTHDDLKKLLPTANYPIIAARVMLPGIEQGQRLQAIDRAHVEGWTLALSVATGGDRVGIEINPLTGKKYQIHDHKTNVSVWGIESGAADQQVIVPKPEAPKPEA
jgi:hypothetical protein